MGKKDRSRSRSRSRSKDRHRKSRSTSEDESRSREDKKKRKEKDKDKEKVKEKAKAKDKDKKTKDKDKKKDKKEKVQDKEDGASTDEEKEKDDEKKNEKENRKEKDKVKEKEPKKDSKKESAKEKNKDKGTVKEKTKEKDKKAAKSNDRENAADKEKDSDKEKAKRKEKDQEEKKQKDRGNRSRSNSNRKKRARSSSSRSRSRSQRGRKQSPRRKHARSRSSSSSYSQASRQPSAFDRATARMKASTWDSQAPAQDAVTQRDAAIAARNAATPAPAPGAFRIQSVEEIMAGLRNNASAGPGIGVSLPSNVPVAMPARPLLGNVSGTRESDYGRRDETFPEPDPALMARAAAQATEAEEKAREFIRRTGQVPRGPPGLPTGVMVINQKFVDFVIGPSGQSLAAINYAAGVNVVLDQNQKWEGYTIAHIFGDEDSTKRAKLAIEFKTQQWQPRPGAARADAHRPLGLGFGLADQGYQAQPSLADIPAVARASTAPSVLGPSMVSL